MNRPQVFLIHFAGGNCYSFQAITNKLIGFDICPLELPGRGKRIREDLVLNFDDAAKDIYKQILHKLNSDEFIIFGHSMGAYLGLKIVSMLEQSNKFPRCLIVGGNPGPGINENKRRYKMDRKEFMLELEMLGGVPQEVLENKELYNFFEPILRADFEIAEEHGLEDLTPVETPIIALMGNKEENCDKITNWQCFTKNKFSHRIFEGGHFFINHHQIEIANLIKDCYIKSKLPSNISS